MHTKNRLHDLSRSWWTCLAVAWMTLCPAWGQGMDVEPNDACLQAQDLGITPLPFDLTGSLDSTPESPDIDFFLFTTSAGGSVTVDLQGASTGQGTLSDPFLGIFDSSCQLLILDDDGGTGLNSRARFNVPPDGMFVATVTACCDSTFEGGGVGSYLLTATPFQAIGSISGRLVDAGSNAPLPGDQPPFAFVELLRCQDPSFCGEFVASQATDSLGSFSFQTNFSGNLLEAGTYQVRGLALGYDPALTAPTAVGPDEDLDLGDIPLQPIPIIGSVSGQLVDALNGQPLSGNMPPFAAVQLVRCNEFGCFDFIAFSSADGNGRFSFDGSAFLIREGTFQLVAFAEQYKVTSSSTFEVSEGEDFDFGVFPVDPLPIQILEVTPCENLPPEGGTCRYSVRLRNGSGGRFRGEAWSNVDAFGLDADFSSSRFQVGGRGKDSPQPQKLNIRTGGGATVDFQFDVPGSVPDFAFICTEAWVGEEPNPQFAPRSNRFLFCVGKQGGGISVLSEKESRKILQQRGRALGRH